LCLYTVLFAYTFYKFKKGEFEDSTIKYMVDGININDKK